MAFDANAQQKMGQSAADRWLDIERGVHGRLGVALLDTAIGTLEGHRLDERFALCSTFKFIAAALTLARVDAGQERLDRAVAIRRADLLEYAPIAEKHVGQAMSVAQLCEAAVTVSDNTAANLLLAGAGGPAGVTAFARRIGDSVTRLDRTEPELNEGTPGDPRDTSTPRAMATTLQTLLLGNALSDRSRAQLVAWMTATSTGAHRLRAGLPGDWRLAHKTGTGRLGITNDVGVIWPPRRAPLVVVTYLAECKSPESAREGALAEVARRVAAVKWPSAS
jgi:beta-lactamase class A